MAFAIFAIVYAFLGSVDFVGDDWSTTCHTLDTNASH